MGFWDFFRKKQPTQTVQKGMPMITAAREVVARSEPPKVGTANRLEAYKTSPWNSIATARVAETVASNFNFRLFKGRSRQNRVEVFEHPLLSLLARPAKNFSRFEIFFTAQAALSLAGDAFLMVLRDSRGRPIEIIPIAPSLVQKTPEPGRDTYEIRCANGVRSYPREDVLWVKRPDPADIFTRGVPPSQPIDLAVQTTAFIDKHVSTYFFNGALPAYLASLEGASETELLAFSARWQEDFQGPEKANQVEFTGMPVNVQRLDTNFRDNELLDLHRYYRDVVAAAHGCPPEILGIIENSNRASIEAAEYLFLKYTVRAWLTIWGQALERAFLTDGEYLEMVNPVPEDAAAIDRAVATAPSCFTKNEMRAAHGFPPVEEGGDFISDPATMTETQQNNPAPSVEESQEDLEVIGQEDSDS